MSDQSFPVRTLGRDGLEVSSLGLGCMGMSQSYGRTDERESVATIHRALDLGIRFLDTADVYGQGHNEELVGRAIVNRRAQVVLATKFGMQVGPDGKRSVRGDPAYVRACCDASLQRLGTDYIDLYYQHRVDANVPIEDTVGAMSELVSAGKVRHLGLSEASSSSLERASAVHAIAALQSEWSLWTRNVEADVVPTARRLGIGIVPFSPLGRGFLTGQITTSDEFEKGDVRASNPRFEAENFAQNRLLVKYVEDMAATKECTPGQLALAWVLSRGDDVVPIPGTKRRRYLDENAKAVAVHLSAAERDQLDELFPAGAWAGERYPTSMSSSYGDSPAREQ